MSLDKLTGQLTEANKNSSNALPPIEKWNPPYCGEIDMEIKSNGDWFYNGSVIKRLPLVKLFASVLMCEIAGNGSKEYFLVTPVEKVKIRVEEAPFVLTEWQWLDNEVPTMEVSTNLGDTFILDSEHCMTMNNEGNLFVNVRRNLTAKVHRNVYYQWVDIADEQPFDNQNALVLTSAGKQFILGTFD